jgi:outer membrane protein assembly factor BamA
MTSLLVLCAWLLGAAPQTPMPGEVIADIRVHGNHVTPDAEVIRLSGLTKGAPVTADTVAHAEKLLKSSGKFDDAQALKRFASIEDPTQILIMLVVNEGPVQIEIPDMPDASGVFKPRITKRGFGKNLMYMPILDGEDGYAVRFGMRVAYVPSARSQTRISFPFTWGGERRAGAEWEKGFTHGRLQFGGALTSSKHPFYNETDARRQAWARAEISGMRMHVGSTASVQRVNFGGAIDSLKTIGVDATIDTRLDPLLPRNAVLITASAEQVRVTPDGGAARDPFVRTKVDGSAYLGLFRQVVLVARAVREDASRTEPLYFKSMLGGMSNLRGFETASFAGDTLVAGTLELRSPITSPIDVGKVGLRVFADAGTVYNKGQRYEDQTLKQGYGAGIFFTAAVFQLNLDVAHGKGAGTRVHVSGGFSF